MSTSQSPTWPAGVDGLLSLREEVPRPAGNWRPRLCVGPSSRNVTESKGREIQVFHIGPDLLRIRIRTNMRHKLSSDFCCYEIIAGFRHPWSWCSTTIW